MLTRLFSNHVLANITFVVVLLLGTLNYFQMPRAQDPEVNFNWIDIATVLPGASTEDVERLVTDPLEDAIQKIRDIKFVSSTSREGISDILVRFVDIDERTFDKRINDLRREIQNKANNDLPAEADDPLIQEITTSNNFPTATLMLVGQATDEVLRKNAMIVRKDIRRIHGVDSVNTAGFADPELHVLFSPEKLRAHGIEPDRIVSTVRAYFHDVVAGNMEMGRDEWLVRVIGTDADPGYLAGLPVVGTRGEVKIEDVAQVAWSHDDFKQMSTLNGQPGVTMAITKQAHTNILELVARIKEYMTERNPVLEASGLRLILLDDQTQTTREAITVMQSNALLGLVLVMFVTWIFLGSRIAFFVGAGIPFSLAATFWILNGMGSSLNQNVLLAVVIVLGMLVDDAVVVVEAIYYRLQRGADAMSAAIRALREVFSPVTASVLTTLAAFLPLMLLPGIVGKFMFVVPFVVSLALAISLFEAYWLLPVHVTMLNPNLKAGGRMQRWRERFTHNVRIRYSRLLIKVLRRPRISLAAVVGLFLLAMGAIAGGMVRMEFFAFDPMRSFYINVEMPPGSSLKETMRVASIVEQKARMHLKPGEMRTVSATAGQMFTDTAPFFGDMYGQVFVSLNPAGDGMRGVADVIDEMRPDIVATVGPTNISMLKLSKGPPVTKPISIKVRGENFAELEAAVKALRGILREIPAVTDIADNNSPGKQELQVRLNDDAIQRAGLDAGKVANAIRLLFDGEIVTYMQHEGERVEVRVQADSQDVDDIDQLLATSLALPSGNGSIPLGQLVETGAGYSRSNIRHYNFRRSITVEADLDKAQMDTVQANSLVKAGWRKIRMQYPNVALDFTGELEDIQESLDSMAVLMLFGVGLIYLILGTQFRSYWQPFMILATVPMAFTGVTFGLIATGNPLSLFTLYGVIALVGIAVNSAIVMIDAANHRLESGMSVLHATVYAARRRVIPILITSATTIAGLFSLATGLAGDSLIWGPVASAIVWGLGFSTILTLFVVPLLYRNVMVRGAVRKAPAPLSD